jgi:hypothetical protein
MTPYELINKSHTFEDGDSITITQIKVRDGNELWVTCSIQQGPGVARRVVMTLNEFMGTYGHLFGFKSEDIPPPVDD